METDTRRTDDESRKKSKYKLVIIILLVLILIAAAVTVWAVWFRSPDKTVLAPDYAPQEKEQNAVPIGDDGDSKMVQPDGGGAVSLSYTKEVEISLKKKEATLFFANPSKSNQDMLIQVVIRDKVVIQSGRLVPGNQVTKLSMLKDSPELSEGEYDGKYVIYYYQPDSGEKAMLNTEVPIKVKVTK